MELISAGFTCFNAEDSIEDAVSSAQAQTWTPLEIIVVDDNSTDGSWRVLERLAGEDRRIQIIRHTENRGVGAARNTVLEHASGDFIAFFDDDDRSRPERLSAQHERITRYEKDTGAKAVLCYTATQRFYPENQVDYAPCLGMDTTPAPSGIDVARLILLGKPADGSTGACPTSSLMARRLVFESINGFDSELRRHEDTDFNLRLALGGAHFAGISQPLVAQTMTFTSDKSVQEEYRHAGIMLKKHRQLLEDWGWYDFCVRWTDMKYKKLESGTTGAIPLLARLAMKFPVKTARKIAWTIPNLREYKRFNYTPKPGGN
jgi:glycosyltransferase involved in cell wall biosynthesis